MAMLKLKTPFKYLQIKTSSKEITLVKAHSKIHSIDLPMLTRMDKKKLTLLSMTLETILEKFRRAFQ